MSLSSLTPSPLPCKAGTRLDRTAPTSAFQSLSGSPTVTRMVSCTATRHSFQTSTVKGTAGSSGSSMRVLISALRFCPSNPEAPYSCCEADYHSAGWISDPLNEWLGRRGVIFIGAIFSLVSVSGLPSVKVPDASATHTTSYHLLVWLSRKAGRR